MEGARDREEAFASCRHAVVECSARIRIVRSEPDERHRDTVDARLIRRREAQAHLERLDGIFHGAELGDPFAETEDLVHVLDDRDEQAAARLEVEVDALSSYARVGGDVLEARGIAGNRESFPGGLEDCEACSFATT